MPASPLRYVSCDAKNRPSIKHVVLCDDRLCWVIPNRYLPPELPPSPISVEGVLPSAQLLQDVPMIALLPGDFLYEQAAALFSDAGIRPQLRLHVPQSTTAWHMACAGIGAALLPKRLVQLIPPNGAEISIYGLDSPRMQRAIYAHYKTDRYLSAPSKQLLQLCRHSRSLERP